MKASGSKRIAERYVKALFDVAKSSSALDRVESDMDALGRALKDSADLRHFLSNPLVPRDHQADAMVAIAAKMGAHAVTRQFVAMLARHKRLTVLPDIITLYAARVAELRGEMTAELVAASPLKPQDVELIGQRLSKAYGKTMKLSARQDASLLGGMIVKIGSSQLDASLAGKLNRLALQLKSA